MKMKKRQPSGTGLPVRNDILRALLNSEYKHLSPELEHVHLKRGEIIYQADQRIDHVYFPETAVVAMIDTVEGGGTVEVGFGTVAFDVAVRIPYWGSRSELIEVLDLARAGQVEVATQRYSLDDGPKAYEALAAGTVRGRAVIVP